MTKFLKIRQRFIVLAISVFAVACNDDDSTTTPPVAIESETIYESASKIPGLSNFLTAVNSASGDLESVLNGSSDITVLAPSNVAFESLASKLGFEGFDDMIENIDKDVLADIIAYHIIDGELNTSSLSGEVTTNLGETLVFGTNEDNQIIAEDDTELPSTKTAGIIVGPNQPRSNGVIHSINKVLLHQDLIDLYSIDIRPNLYELAVFHEYTALIAAVDKAGEKASLEKPDLTFFLPTNEAISDLLDALGDDYDTIADFDNAVEIEVLSDIIKYHLFQPETALVAGTHETLLEDNDVTIIGSGASAEIDDYTATNATIVETEIGDGAVNGAAYAVDKVLLPQTALDFLDILASDDLLTTVTDQGTLSSLEEAVILLELGDDLDDTTNDSENPEGGFTYFNTGTIFAPSDAAFQDLFDLMGSEYNSIADFDTEYEKSILKDIILYHIVSGSFMANDLSAGSLTTEQGDDIKITESLLGDITLENDTDNVHAEIITEDIHARNGLVHIIDKVLLPESALEFISFLD